MPDDTDKPMPDNVIGLHTRYLGTSGELAYLQGHEVFVVGVIRGAPCIKGGTEYPYLGDEEDLVAARGVDPAAD